MKSCFVVESFTRPTDAMKIIFRFPFPVILLFFASFYGSCQINFILLIHIIHIRSQPHVRCAYKIQTEWKWKEKILFPIGFVWATLFNYNDFFSPAFWFRLLVVGDKWSVRIDIPINGLKFDRCSKDMRFLKSFTMPMYMESHTNLQNKSRKWTKWFQQKKKREREMKKMKIKINFGFNGKSPSTKSQQKRNIAFIFSWNLHESKTKTKYVTCSWPSDAIACRMERREANNTKFKNVKALY